LPLQLGVAVAVGIAASSANASHKLRMPAFLFFPFAPFGGTDSGQQIT